jgi:hypothetical protein
MSKYLKILTVLTFILMFIVPSFALPTLTGPNELFPDCSVVCAGGGGGSSGNDGFDNLSIADTHISQNKTAAIAAALTLADAHIATNVSGGSGADGYSNLSTADKHIFTNWTNLMLNLTFGDFNNLSVADNHIGSNKSVLEGFIAENKTTAIYAALALADAHIATNISGSGTNDGFSNLSQADKHIAYNRTEIMLNVTNADFSNLSESDRHLQINRSQIMLNLTFGDFDNRTILDNHISINRTEIMLNMSKADFANLSVADSHILQNKSDLYGMLSTNISAVNRNLSLMANITIMAQSLIPHYINPATLNAPNSTFNQSHVFLTFPYSATVQYNSSIDYVMPSNYNGGNLQFSFIHMSSGAGSAQWGARVRCIADGSNLEGPWSGNASVMDTTTANTLQISPLTGTITPAGTPGSSSLCNFLFSRDIGGGNAAQEELIGVKVAYGMA